MKTMIEKFKTVKLSTEQMKIIKGGADCQNLGAFHTCLDSGQPYNYCWSGWCPFYF
jgi:hypothetical protein